MTRLRTMLAQLTRFVALSLVASLMPIVLGSWLELPAWVAPEKTVVA